LLQLRSVAAFVLVWTLAVPATGAAGGPPETAVVFDLGAGVIVDPGRPAVYLMNPDGGIGAIDPRSGESLWNTAAAAKPLLLHDDLLFAQSEPSGGAGKLHVVTLEAKSGDAASFATALKLPDGVSASIDHGRHSSFQASARAHDGDLFVSWSFSQPATKRGEKPKIRRAVVRVDMESGRTEQVEPDQVPATPRPRLPDTVAQAVDRGSLLRQPRLVGGWYAAPARADGEAKDGVVLKRWHAETGEPAPDVALFDGEAAVRYASADGRHLLASRLDVEGDPHDRYVWWIFSLEDGRRVATVRRPLVAAPFFLSGSSLIHLSPAQSRLVEGRSIEEPLSLRAIHIETGARLWARPVRDTKHPTN
jgi:hypothetical protein